MTSRYHRPKARNTAWDKAQASPMSADAALSKATHTIVATQSSKKRSPEHQDKQYRIERTIESIKKCHKSIKAKMRKGDLPRVLELTDLRRRLIARLQGLLDKVAIGDVSLASAKEFLWSLKLDGPRPEQATEASKRANTSKILVKDPNAVKARKQRQQPAVFDASRKPDKRGVAGKYYHGLPDYLLRYK